MAGFVVFSVLGYMSEKQQKPISEVAQHGEFCCLVVNSFDSSYVCKGRVKYCSWPKGYNGQIKTANHYIGM